MPNNKELLNCGLLSSYLKLLLCPYHQPQRNTGMKKIKLKLKAENKITGIHDYTMGIKKGGNWQEMHPK